MLCSFGLLLGALGDPSGLARYVHLMTYETVLNAHLEIAVQLVGCT